MTTDIIDHFSPLDEMIQLIYQSIYQFVVMPSATYDKWMVHVGMVGDAGRWWRGVWEEKDVVSAVGPKPSEKLLETFVDKLVDSIIGGELYLADFSTEEGAKIKLTFGSTSTKPVSMALEDITPTEAVAHATNVFLEIALQAQSRKCRLHPSAFTFISDISSRPLTGLSKASSSGPMGSQETRTDIAKEEIGRTSGSSNAKAILKSPEHERHDVEMMEAERDAERPRREEKEISKKRLLSSPEKTQPSVKPKAAARLPAKANPNKKTRKIQAIEFESDDE